MEIVSTVVDRQRNLIGFILEGMEREFGGFTSNLVGKPVQLAELARRNFANDQLAIKNNHFQELGKFKINELPMKLLVDNGFVDINNEIMLRLRYIQNNTTVGFGVEFGDGSKVNFTYKNVVQLCSWFKPGNFVIRTQENGNVFIAGKPGVLRLNELPIKYIGGEPEHKKSNVKSKKANKSVKSNNTLIAEKDILDLYDLIREYNGVVINLPTEKYEATQQASQVVSSEFKSLGIGEAGSPYISFGSNKLNANTTFKKIGNVNVEVAPNTVLPVNTYTFSTKSVFSNGENHIKRFGIAISKDGADRIVKEFGDTLGIRQIKDEVITKPITALILNGEDAVFLEVDTDKIALIAPSKIDKCILSAEEISNELENMAIPKLVSKYLAERTGLLAELKKKLGTDDLERATNKEPLNIFKLFGPDIVSKIQEAGINIYSGAFTKTVAVKKDAVSSKGGKKADENPEITIEYELSGIDFKKLTYKVLKACKDESIPTKVKAVIHKFEAMDDTVDKYKMAKRYLDNSNKVVDDVLKKLWMHKCAMYIKSGKTAIHTDDKDIWEVDTKRRTKATVYKCTKPGLEKLSVVVDNIKIK